MFFKNFYVFSLFACGSARVLNSSPGILLRVQNRKIVPDIIPAGQKSVLIPGRIWPHIILRAQKSVLIPGHIWPLAQVRGRTILFFFENGPKMDLAGGYSHTRRKNGTPLFRQKKLIVKSSLMWQ